jgi:hypothetical protein
MAASRSRVCRSLGRLKVLDRDLRKVLWIAFDGKASDAQREAQAYGINFDADEHPFFEMLEERYPLLPTLAHTSHKDEVVFYLDGKYRAIGEGVSNFLNGFFA